MTCCTFMLIALMHMLSEEVICCTQGELADEGFDLDGIDAGSDAFLQELEAELNGT